MSDVRLKPLGGNVADAARTLARAFVTNPLHVAAFGPDQLARNEAFFRIGLSVMKGPKLVARAGERILGVIHWVQSPTCQFWGLEKLRMMPSMIRGFGLPAATRVGSWLSAWAREDPRTAHLHLGPIGVDPEAQGRGIGKRLMMAYCEELDRRGVPGYLETDRPENVAFYRRFGFETTAQIQVLNVPNYLMTRRTPGT